MLDHDARITYRKRNEIPGTTVTVRAGARWSPPAPAEVIEGTNATAGEVARVSVLPVSFAILPPTMAVVPTRPRKISRTRGRRAAIASTTHATAFDLAIALSQSDLCADEALDTFQRTIAAQGLRDCPLAIEQLLLLRPCDEDEEDALDQELIEFLDQLDPRAEDACMCADQAGTGQHTTTECQRFVCYVLDQHDHAGDVGLAAIADITEAFNTAELQAWAERVCALLAKLDSQEDPCDLTREEAFLAADLSRGDLPFLHWMITDIVGRTAACGPPRKEEERPAPAVGEIIPIPPPPGPPPPTPETFEGRVTCVTQFGVIDCRNDAGEIVVTNRTTHPKYDPRLVREVSFWPPIEA